MYSIAFIITFISSLFVSEPQIAVTSQRTDIAMSEFNIEDDRMSFRITDSSVLVLFYATNRDTSDVTMIQSNRGKFTICPMPEVVDTLFLMDDRMLPSESLFLITMNTRPESIAKCNRLILFFLGLFIAAFCLMSIAYLQIVSYKRKLNEKANQKNIELEKVNSDLKRANDDKSKLFSIIAHDLKNPLNAIIGFSDLLIERYSAMDDKKRVNYISIVNRSSKFLYETLVNLLDWAKCQSGRLQYNPSMFAVNKVLSTAVEYNQAASSRKEITVTVNLNCEEMVFADQNMLNIVLRNLIGNAIKYSRRGSVVAVEVCNSDAKFLSIFVKDCGVGMNEEQINSIMNSDNCISTLGTDFEQGSGLGLNLCRDFIYKMHGEMIINSTPNVSTEVEVRIPKNEIC